MQAARRDAESSGLVLAGYAALLIVQCKVLWGSWARFDLQLWDGSWYFQWAREIASTFTFPSFENAPAYCAFYAPFHLLGLDAFDTFFAHRVISHVLIAALSYLLLCRLFAVPIALALASYALLLTGDEGPTDYLVRYFVLIPACIALLGSLHGSPLGTAVMLTGAFLAAAVRPEYAVVLPALLLVLAPRWARELRRRWPAMPAPARAGHVLSALAAAAAAAFLVHDVLAPSPRAWLAFAQHYAVGYDARHASDLGDPWLHWRRYAAHSFGDSRSIGQALLANPAAFLEHVRDTASDLPGLWPAAFWPVLLPAPEPLGDVVRRAPAVLLGACTLFVLAALARGLVARKLPALLPGTSRFWTLLCIFVAANLLAMVMMQPIVHHASLLRLLGLIAAGTCVQAGVRRLRLPLGPPALALLAAAIVLSWPALYATPGAQPIRAAVRLLPRLPGDGPYGLMGDSAGSFCAYSEPDRCVGAEVLANEPGSQGLLSYLREHRVRIIVLGDRMFRFLPREWLDGIRDLVLRGSQTGWRAVGETPLYMVFARDAAPEGVANGEGDRDRPQPIDFPARDP